VCPQLPAFFTNGTRGLETKDMDTRFVKGVPRSKRLNVDLEQHNRISKVEIALAGAAAQWAKDYSYDDDIPALTVTLTLVRDLLAL